MNVFVTIFYQASDFKKYVVKSRKLLNDYTNNPVPIEDMINEADLSWKNWMHAEEKTRPTDTLGVPILVRAMVQIRGVGCKKC